MQNLIDGVARFQQLVVPTKAALFARLARTHNPATLFIGCSDARVLPELITQSEPGELFVIRTAGNLVPAYAPGAPDGVAASITPSPSWASPTSSSVGTRRAAR
jgi:carbonic anhydrase